MATNHSYKTGTYGGVDLHVITTAASNIKLLNLRQTDGGLKVLRNTSHYGVNGGWYNMSTDLKLLNIAMQDGQPVGPSTQGNTNDVGMGAVAWNGTQVSAYTQAMSASDISGISGTGTWIQGGIALWIGYQGWEQKVKDQWAGTYLTGTACRTAMVGKLGYNQVDLFVTVEKVTFAAFRSAVQAFYGITSDSAQANNSHQGIMLDGSYSSQMRAKNSSNTTVNVALSDSSGSYRPIAQLVTLKSTT